jgi:hypothetical protein
MMGLAKDIQVHVAQGTNDLRKFLSDNPNLEIIDIKYGFDYGCSINTNRYTVFYKVPQGVPVQQMNTHQVYASFNYGFVRVSDYWIASFDSEPTLEQLQWAIQSIKRNHPKARDIVIQAVPIP